MIAGAIAALGPCIAQAQASDSEPIVRLPAFTVTDSRLLPPPESWRYARVPGFEILSSAPDGTTEHLIRDFLLFHRTVETIWPTIRMNASVSASLILCRRSDQFGKFVPANAIERAGTTFSLSLQDREDAAFVVNLAIPESSGPGNLSDYSIQMLHDEYVHFVVGRIGPRTPSWLEAALAAMFRALVCGEDTAGLPGISDPNLEARKTFAAAHGAGLANAKPLAKDKDFAAAVLSGAFMPLDRLFSIDSSAPESGRNLGEGTNDPWARQSYEFAHMCIFGFRQEHRSAFIKFAYLAAREPLSEDLFKRCFNLGYGDMLARLWGYVGFAEPVAFRLQADEGKSRFEVPRLALREASDAESSRMIGEARRMAGRVDDARHSLIAPYVRGSRDPELLASLGLAEHAAGLDDRARRFLEAAASAKTVRARAYVELARLRLQEALSHPAGSDGRLGTEQLAAVLQPLLSARACSPPLQETYETIADAWSHAAMRPAPDRLRVIDEGVALFPYDTDLVYDDARLQSEIGRRASASALCALGLEFATGPDSRQRFLALQEKNRD